MRVSTSTVSKGLPMKSRAPASSAASFLSGSAVTETVHVRHLQVEDDQVEAVLQVQRRHLARVGGALHLLVTAGLEQEFEQLHVHRFVVDDQDARAADVGLRDHGAVLMGLFCLRRRAGPARRRWPH
jgi:hypothetical protein